MAPPAQTAQSESTFETLYPIDVEASVSDKLSRVARAFRSRTIDSSKIVNVQVYGYLRSELQYDTAGQRTERVAMQSRFDVVRNTLIRLGVPYDDIWIGGVAFAANMGGQINVYTNEKKVSSVVLPPYVPYVPSNDPGKAPQGKEPWLDAEGNVKKDVLENVIFIEIELSLKEGGIFRTKPPVSIKAKIRSDGKIELGPEWTVLEQEIAKKAAWGAVQDVKFKISVEGTVGVKYDDRKLQTEVNAAIKTSLAATLVIPGTKIKIPVEVSIGVDVEGKPVPGLEVTYRW